MLKKKLLSKLRRGMAPYKMQEIAYALTAAGIAGIIWRAGTLVSVPIYWVSKSAVIAAGCALVAGVLFNALPYARQFLTVAKRYRFVAALLITPFIGLAWSSLAGFGWGAYFPAVRAEYVKIVFMLFLFSTTAYCAIGSARHVRLFFSLIAASCIPLWLSLDTGTGPFRLDVGRLTGTGNDPNFLAAWIAVALAAAAVFFLWERDASRWIWLAASFLIAPLLLWTACRAAWLTALVAGIIILFLHFKRGCPGKRAGDAAIFAAVAAASLICGFFLFPPLSRVVIAVRALAPFVSHDRLVRVIRQVAPPDTIRKEDFPKENSVFGIGNELAAMVGNDRGWLWKEGAVRLARTPFGFGQAYYFWNPVGTEGLWIKHKLNAHDLWIDVGLSMGWLGLAVWLLFVFRGVQDALRAGWNGDPERIAVAISLLALLFIGTFMDMFTQPVLWIVMGLAAGSAARVTTPESPSPIRP